MNPFGLDAEQADFNSQFFDLDDVDNVDVAENESIDEEINDLLEDDDLANAADDLATQAGDDSPEALDLVTEAEDLIEASENLAEQAEALAEDVEVIAAEAESESENLDGEVSGDQLGDGTDGSVFLSNDYDTDITSANFESEDVIDGVETDNPSAISNNTVSLAGSETNNDLSGTEGANTFENEPLLNSSSELTAEPTTDELGGIVAENLIQDGLNLDSSASFQDDSFNADTLDFEASEFEASEFDTANGQFDEVNELV